VTYHIRVDACTPSGWISTQQWSKHLADETDLTKSYQEFWDDLFLEADLAGCPQQEAFFKLYSQTAAEAGECTDLTYTPARKDGPWRISD